MRRTAAMSMLGLMMVALAVPAATPAQAVPVIVRDDTSAVRKLSGKDTVSAFRVKFTSEAGQQHRVRAKWVATVPTTQNEPLMLASTTVNCWGPGETLGGLYDYAHTINAQMNVLRGETVPIGPRWTYTTKVSGEQTCELVLHTVDHMHSKDDPSTHVITVDPGSYLEVTAPLPGGSDQVRMPRTSPVLVLRPTAPKANILSRTYRAPSGASSISVNADVMLTACTGSSDAGCRTSDMNKDYGGVYAAQLIVGQLKVGGGYCAVTKKTPSWGLYERITRWRHHRTVTTTAAVKVGGGCTNRFQIYLNLRWIKGAGIKVHDYTAVSAAIPNTG